MKTRALPCGLALLLAGSATAQTIPNPNFSDGHFPTWPGYVGQGSNPAAIPGWIGSGPQLGLNDRSVLVPAPFADNGTSTSGGNVAFLQSTGSPTTLSTTITGLEPGRAYLLRFMANTRADYFTAPASGAAVSVDGSAFVDIDGPPVAASGTFSTPFRQVEIPFTATSASAALVLRKHGPPGADQTLLVDDFEVRPVEVRASFVVGRNGHYGGGVPLLQTLPYGGTPAVPPVVPDPSWQFLGWTPAVGPMMSDMVFRSDFLRSQTVTPTATPAGGAFGFNLVVEGDRALATDRDGRAYILERQPGGDWGIVHTLVDPNGSFDAGRFLGEAAPILAIRGGTALIANQNSATLHWLERDAGGSWSARGPFPSAEAPVARVFSVALTGTHAFFAVLPDPESPAAPPAIRVFERTAGDWLERAPLALPEGVSASGFAYNLRASGDAVIASSGLPSLNFGTVVFSYTFHEFVLGGDGEWAYQGTVPAPAGVATFDLEGDTLAYSHLNQGRAPGDTNKVHIYRRNGPGSWSATQVVTPDTPEEVSGFGRSLAVDGDTLVAGGGDPITGGSGLALLPGLYVFHRSGGIWTRHAIFRSADPGPAIVFGRAADVSGSTVLANILDFAANTESPGSIEFKEISVGIEDADGDGIDDDWEITHFGSLTATDGSGDADGDTLDDFTEFRYNTNPLARDTDGDRFPDRVEVNYLMRPGIADDGALDAALEVIQDSSVNLNLGGPYIGIDGGTIRLRARFERSPTLDPGTWTPVGDPIELDLPVDEDTSFFRLFLDGSPAGGP